MGFRRQVGESVSGSSNLVQQTSAQCLRLVYQEARIPIQGYFIQPLMERQKTFSKTQHLHGLLADAGETIRLEARYMKLPENQTVSA
jgi:hypothetical protein